MNNLKRLFIVASVALSVATPATAILFGHSQEADEPALIAGYTWGDLQGDDKPDDEGDPPSVNINNT